MMLYIQNRWFYHEKSLTFAIKSCSYYVVCSLIKLVMKCQEHRDLLWYIMLHNSDICDINKANFHYLTMLMILLC